MFGRDVAASLNQTIANARKPHSTLTTLIIATRNSHKVEEIRAILSGPYRYLTLRDFPDVPAVVEDAETLAGNATKKAVQLAEWLCRSQTRKSKLPASSDGFVLADDSGLEVDALNGAPGVHSARFAALDNARDGNSPDAANNAKLLRLLKNLPLEKRTARFRCLLALVKVHPPSTIGETELFEGACEGRIIEAPRGQNGFGYDPLFVPDGFEKSFAELGEEIKNQLSHRAKALTKLRQRLLRGPP